MAEVINNQISTYSVVGNDTFIGSLTAITQLPTINQMPSYPHHCTPTAAADIIRYAQLYMGMVWNTNKQSYASFGGYNAFIAELETYMYTGKRPIGNPITGTVDSYVAAGMQDFLVANTNFTAWVNMYGGSSSLALPTFDTYKTYINAEYPVLVTLPKAVSIVVKMPL